MDVSLRDAIAHGLLGCEQIAPGLLGSCPQCQRDHGLPPRQFHAMAVSGELVCEPHHSGHPCECCGTLTPGKRYVAHGTWEDGEQYHFGVCEPCGLYLEKEAVAAA